MIEIIIKIERGAAFLNKILKEKLFRSKQIYVPHRISEYHAMWAAVAEEIGGKFTILEKDVWEIESNGRKTIIANDKLEFDNPVTLEIAGRKPLIYKLFKESGLRVPEHVEFRLEELEKAYDFLNRHPDGCVVKPADGTSSGMGVTTHILTHKEIRKAAILASLYCRELLIESLVPGECYRALVLNGKMIHVVCRRGRKLRGDGLSTISKLIEKENENLRQQNMPTLEMDRDSLFSLKYQKLSLDSVPDENRNFVIKSVNAINRKMIEIRTIYNETVTDNICDSIRKNAEFAAKIVNSEFVGVDFITTDPSIPLEMSLGVINEINTTPGLHHHYNINTEKYPKPALCIVNALLKKERVN